MIRRVYLAGPMTGIPQMNFPRFDEAAADLRSRGYEVVSPAELDSPASRAAALAAMDGDLSGYSSQTGESWGDLLARDVKLIADEGIQAIVVLEGWEKSRGARLETFVARLCGIPVIEYRASSPLLPVFPPTLEDIHGDISEGAPEELVEDPGADIYETLSDITRKAQFAAFGLASEEVTVAGEQRIVNTETGGEKGRKPERMELLPWDVLRRDVAPLFAFGASKYADHNWRRGFDWSLSFGAMQRHAAQFWSGEDTDEETGCAHMASVVFHALALLHFAYAHPSLDDRPPVAECRT